MKILLCNEAFIGDLILSTAVLKPLKRAYPDCQIGFLVGSWAKEVVENHRFVDFVHAYDQKSFNRKKVSKKRRKNRERWSKKKALREVMSLNYDVAIDLHSYYKENSAHFIFQAQIPKRVGYWSSAKPFFFNEILFWNCTEYHMLENHKVMLEEFGVPQGYLEHFSPCLEYKSEISKENLKRLPSQYILVHVGTGEYDREWPKEHWREVAKRLDLLDIPLVFIGKGNREKMVVEYVISGLKNALNFANIFSWKELLDVVKRAKFLVGLESMAGHLAATFGTPALLIYAGKLPVNWRPYHPLCHTIMPPEYSKEERQKMLPKKPIHFLTSEKVIEKLDKLLAANRFILPSKEAIS